MDLATAIDETEMAMELFLQNKFDEAEQKMAAFSDRSIYHALGHGTILFIRAMMSCERAEMDRAMVAVCNGCALINQFRARNSFAHELLQRIRGNYEHSTLTNAEMHAELCHSELLMGRALLSFFADEHLTGLIKGAFRIRSCFNSFKDLHRQLSLQKSIDANRADGNNDSRIRLEFEAGVRGGFGLFNLMLSAMPARLAMILQLIGFSGDKNLGMLELTKSAKMDGTLRSPLAKMVILCHQLVINFLIGADQPDLDLCRQLIQPLAQKYPNGAIVLFLLARFRLVSGQLDESLQLYRASIRAQNIYPQFHHICHWELVIGNTILLHWNRAAWHAKKLLDESRWSKCIYAYFLAILVDADRSVEKRKEAVRLLMRKVPTNRIKIAGKSLPMEKFCERRAHKWLERDNKGVHGGELLLPQFEFLYLWNGFSLIENCPWLIRPILDHLDLEWANWQKMQNIIKNGGNHEGGGEKEEEMLWKFLHSICLRTMGQFGKAEQGFESILQNEFNLHGTSSAYLLPNACLELAITRLKHSNDDQNKLKLDIQPLLMKALSYRGYALETKLHFRVHGALQKLNK